VQQGDVVGGCAHSEAMGNVIENSGGDAVEEGVVKGGVQDGVGEPRWCTTDTRVTVGAVLLPTADLAAV